MSKASRLRREKASVERVPAGPVEPYPDIDGYLYVDLQHSDGSWDTRRVHELVAEAFNGPCPEGMELYHLNGDVTDNRLANLGYRPRG